MRVSDFLTRWGRLRQRTIIGGLVTALTLAWWQEAAAQLRPTRRPPAPPPGTPPARPAPATVPIPVPPRTPPVARVRGEVLDSATLTPLIAATVQFVASNDPARVRSATTDSLGFYRVDSLPTGIYLVGILHPQVDRLGLDGGVLTVQVADTGEVSLPLGLPSVSTIVASRCRGAGADLPAGVFLGTVRRADGAPLVAAGRVRAQYLESVVGPNGLTRRFPARFGPIDEMGRFAVCGVPANATLTTRAYAGTDSSGVVELLVPANGLLLRDLVIAQPQRITISGAETADRPRTVLRGTGRVRGIVRDSAGRPLVGARVAHSDGGVETTSTTGGQFTLDGLPGGSWMLETRAVGFQPRRTVVDIFDSSEVSTTIGLEAVAPRVDTMRVIADRFSQQLAGFESRRKTGFGYFLDEETITRRNATFMSDLLRTTPGVTIVPGPGGRDRVQMRGAAGPGGCTPNVFLNGANTPLQDGVLENLVQTTDVRAIEVYPGNGSIPVEFQGRNGCGAIVIWTGARTGGGRRRAP